MHMSRRSVSGALIVYYVWVDAKDTNANVTARQVNTASYSTTADTDKPTGLENLLTTTTETTLTKTGLNFLTDNIGVDKVRIFYSITDNKATASYDTVLAPLPNEYTITGLLPGTRYYSWTEVWDKAGNIAFSHIEGGILTKDETGPYDLDKLAVSGATATSIDITGFDLVQDNDDVASFDVFYATTTVKPTTASVTLTKAEAGTKYTITGLTASTGYYTWVDAKDATGNVTTQQVGSM